MALIDLKKFSGLALAFDGSRLVPQENGTEIGTREVVKISDVRPQLLNPELTCPSVFYYVFSGLDRKSLLKRKRLKFDMYVIPANLAGIEYVKTRGVSAGNFPVLIDVVHGFTTLLLQRNLSETDIPNSVSTTVVRLKKGEKYIIPPKYDFVFVNSRQSLSVVSLIYSSRCRMRSVFDETRGSSNYVIRKNARLEVVQNPAYRQIKRFRACKPEFYYKEFSLTAKTPIFKQILRKYQRFKWLHEPSKIDWTKIRDCS